MRPFDISSLIYYLENQWLDRVFFHVGEGKSTDPRSLDEFAFLDYVGLAIPGVVVIHGIALTDDELDDIVVSHKKRSLHLIKPAIGDLGEQHYNEMMDLLDEVLEDVAPLVEDEPGSRPGYPRSLN